MLLVANGSVFTRNAQTPFIPNGAVAIDGDTIVEVGPECELKAKYPDAEYVDARGNLIMPGLINMHVHLAGNGKPQKTGIFYDFILFFFL